MILKKIFETQKAHPVLNLYVLFTLIGMLLNQQNACGQVSVSPSRLFFEGKPGETVSRMLTISNVGSKAYEFNTSLKDWKRDANGLKVYEDPGKLKYSNASHIKLSERMITINPGESKRVPVYMQIPLSGTDSISTNSMLFLTQNVMDEEQSNIPAIGVRVGYEYGVQLFYTPYGAKSGEFEFLEFDYSEVYSKDKKKNNSLRLKYKNTGQLNKTGVLILELTDKKTGKEIKLEAVELAIMPLDSQIVDVNLPKGLIPGEYLVVAMLYGDSYQSKNNLKIAKKSIHVK